MARMPSRGYWIVAMLIGALIPTLAQAFQDGHRATLEIPRPGLEPPVADWRLASQGESRLNAFRQATGGTWEVTEWNAMTGTPHLVWGSGIDLGSGPVTTRDQAIGLARTFVATHPDFLGSAGADLEVRGVTHHGGKWAVNFIQVHDGARVVDGRADVLMTDGGRVFLFGADLFANVHTTSSFSLDADAAYERAVASVGFSTEGASRQVVERVIIPEVSASGLVYREAYRILHYHDEGPGRWESYVDAASGDVVWRMDRLHLVDLEGIAHSDVQNQSWCDGVTDTALEHLEVSIDGVGTAVTDATGAFTVPYGGTDDQTFSVAMAGPWAATHRADGGVQAGASFPVTPGVPIDFAWTDVNSNPDERDGFFHTNRVHDFITGLDPDLDWAGWPNGQMRVNVGRSDSVCPCNAWWDGTTINFCMADGGCASTATVGDVVYHEYGHAVTSWMYAFGNSSGTLGEGNSDIIANFITDYSMIGYGFFASNCNAGIRNSENTLRYPEDVNGAIHHDGQIIAGFIWDMRQGFEAAWGTEAGEQYAAELWHFGRKAGLPESLPDQAMWTFAWDDNDGDLTNGTPNWAILCEAAQNHGFDCFASPGVHISHPALFDPTSIDSAYPATATAFSTDGIVIPSSVTLQYRVNGGAFTGLVMDESETEYLAHIPAQFYGDHVEYYIEADDNLGNTGTAPPDAPTTLYDFTVAAYSDAFEVEDPNWTAGAPDDDATNGQWERVDPVGTAAQPYDDYTLWPGTDAWITKQHVGAEGGWPGQSNVNGGKTTLTSPIFDLTGTQDFATLRYRRWFSNDTGANGNEDPWLVEISNDGGQNWVEVENTTESDRSWRLVEIDLLALFPTPDDLQVRFVASDYGSNAIVEAGVDNFSVIADLGAAPVAVEPSTPGMPSAVYLASARPNPFTPRTSIQYGTLATGSVDLAIYDVTGRRVRTLVRTNQEAGHHAVSWDGRDDSGNRLASGVYFYRIVGPGIDSTRRVALLR